MSKAVLMSIQPKWCELIASGKKTVEVRKSKPKLEPPFKVYIYCTKPKEKLLDVVKDGDEFFGETYHGKTKFIKSDEGSVCDMYGKRQKVIGEFICDKFIPIAYDNGVYYTTEQCGRACMTVEEARKYGKGKQLYGWHISNLIIYDKPKELREFCIVDNEAVKRCEHRKRIYNSPDFTNGAMLPGSYFCKDKTDWCRKCKTKPITRPPQSWCYVEEV